MTPDRSLGSPRLPVLNDEDEVWGEPMPSTPPSTSILDRQVELGELLDLAAFRDVCASFVDLYKIGLKIFDYHGTKLVDIRVGSGDWCGYIFQNSEGRAQCTRLVQRIKQFLYPALREGEVVEQTCFSGLKYVIMPITYGGDVLGRVVYGPFLPADQRRPGDAVYTYTEGFEPQKLWNFGSTVRRASDEMIIKILTNFRGVVDTITFIAMKSMMTQQLHLESITQSYNELTEANKELTTSYEKLRDLDRMKSNFLAMISHELRTPLTSVIGYSEMLLGGMAGDISDGQRKFVTIIQEKGEALLALISTLLDMSKIEAGAMELHVSEVDVLALLESAETYVVPQASKKAVTLHLEVAPDLPVFLGDLEKIRQSVVNLLGNAVKFTPEGGRIDILADRFVGQRRYSGEAGRFGVPEEEFLRLQVHDTGVGIPADKLDRVFNSFYQVDNSITREYGGTGLGLAIVKRFVEAHKGEVWVDSPPGEGTTFSLLFPLNAELAGSVSVRNLGD